MFGFAGVLDALDAELLAPSNCYFGGGTAIALRYGEYRESVDVDFLVSDSSGYSSIRESVHAARRIQRADQSADRCAPAGRD